MKEERTNNIDEEKMRKEEEKIMKKDKRNVQSKVRAVNKEWNKEGTKKMIVE